MTDQSFDLIVIGAGPGGYVCAIRAAQLGMTVACVEERKTLGGTCLNVGCIPSKALLQASEKYGEALHALSGFGVKVEGVSLDLDDMLEHKDKVVEANVKGVEFLFKKNKIAWLKGTAKVAAPGKVEVAGAVYAAKHIVIASGSDSIDLPGIAVDEERIVSSTGALDLAAVPEKMAVIGGGYIGLELGTVWQRLGARVTVVEFLDRLVPAMDREISTQFQRVLRKQGMTFKFKTKVTGAVAGENGVKLTLEAADGGKSEEMETDVLLVAVGRKPRTAGLGLDAIGVQLDSRGRIATGERWRTTVDGIYAIGDAIAGPMLAHKAEEEGVAVAEMLAGGVGHVNYETVPGIVYTWPEVATVGKTEEELKASAVAYKVGRFPFAANGRARAMNATEGFVKILADAETDRILGCHIIGAEAGTLIHEVIVAMEFGGSAEDLARSFHGHPTLNESVKEAALGVAGRAIHV
ncbi:MAG: dihydrolipoyl dehydrogenase [Rhodospirillales bacterium]|nr:dihydrolipoyl dehydrogenase [Rhodospirillales bacterium]